jgi:recombination protein RecA
MSHRAGRVILTSPFYLKEVCVSDQHEKLRLFQAAKNKELIKAGLKPLIMASEIYIPPRQSSGILSLDVALGGGWPANRWIEIVGESSASKTSSILHTIATNQAMNPDYSVYWVASEPYNPEWAALCGVDNDRVTVFEHNNMELCFQNVIDAAKANIYDCIVIDSYPAMIASDEEEKDMSGFTVGGGARRVGQFFRKIPDTFSDERPYVGFFVNQYRDKIGGFSPYGTPKTEPGGKAKNYQFYQRIKVALDEIIDESRDGQGKVAVGQRVKFEVTKNKAGAPRRTATADMYFDKTANGFKPGDYDKVRDVITMAISYKIITRGGSWYSYGDYKWQGANPIVEELRGNIELLEEITKKTLDFAIAKE